MGRNNDRQTYHLQPRPHNIPLTVKEIDTILRAADELVGRGGRHLLTKILKGSKDKRVLQHDLDKNPCYGVWHDWPSQDVLAAIDRAIVDRFLSVVYSGQLPVLIYTDLGWERERRLRIEEFLEEWTDWVTNGVTPASMEYLKDRDRQLIFEFLEWVRGTGDLRFIPLLEQWATVDYKKVRARIHHVIADLLDRPIPR